MAHRPPETPSPAPRAPVRAAALLLAAAALAMRADDKAGDVPAAAHAEVRRQILSEFRFAPPPAAQEALPPVLSAAARPGEPGAQQPGGSDIVAMETYTVRETARMGELHEDIAREHAAAVTAAEMRRLGVGIHDVQVGKLHLFAGTIFYVPFVIGAGVAW